MGDREAVVGARDRRLLPVAHLLPARVGDVVRDLVAGALASVVLIANIVSFGALMFPGPLAGGVPIAVWAMLIGSAIGGLWIARTTSLPPIATGIDSPTGAVLVLLSWSTASRVLQGGGGPVAAVQLAMLVFTATTLLSGALLLCLGARRWGPYFRFVPYFVVGGFLGATGWFLLAGGVRMVAGGPLDLEALTARWTVAETARLATAGATLAVLLGLRRWVRSAFALPTALVLMWLGTVWGLDVLGLSGREHGWFLPSLGALRAWSPLTAASAAPVPWSIVAGLVPEMVAVAVVALISLVTKVASLEVARQVSADLDQEFRSHGVASLLAAPFGGLMTSLQVGTSRLLEQAGGATRMCGACCALIMGVVALTNVDLPGMIPIPVVAGLVFYLGYTFVTDAFWRPLSQRAWSDAGLALGIMLVCVRYGYLAGVLVGVVCACLLFATSYARIDVVRRATTGTRFASYVDRSPQEADHLGKRGEAIRIYWLWGYIFFGSSESVVARIRRDVEALPPGTVQYVVVDFGAVTGTDSSAVISLTKLRSFCDRQGATLVCCSLSPAIRRAVERGGVLGRAGRHRVFDDLNLGLAWCEDELLARADLEAEAGLAGFEPWLQRQLGTGARAADLLSYFERREVEGPQVLYRPGEAADTVDLVAAGSLAIDFAGGEGSSLRLRRIRTHTVVGEMGFFRRSVRSATVSSDGPATVFTITRRNFERMQAERPELASAFYEFIIGVLAQRIESSNRVAVGSRT